MAGDWRTLKVDQIKASDPRAIAIGPFGSRMKADVYVPAGIPVIRGNNISDTRALAGEFVYVSSRTADELRSCNVYPGDLVFPHRGAIGQVGIVPDNGVDRWMLSTSLMKLTCNTDLVDPKFVFYYFRSGPGRHALLEHASTVGTPGIGQPLASLRSIEIPVPPLSEQRSVAHILGTLDDKIELNRRMNETLEAMARALFKSWFVDFDPVRAKAEGRDPSLPQHIAALFPDSFVESELGEVPAGWKRGSMLDYADLLSGGTPSTSVPTYWDGDVPWVSAKDVSASQGLFVLDSERKITPAGVSHSSTKVLPQYTTIVTARGTVGAYCLLGRDMAMNQTNYGLKAKAGGGDFFVFFSLANLVSELKRSAYGTIFDTVTTKTFASTSIPIPTRDVVSCFEQQAAPLMERILLNLHESRALAALRDSLLPRLISGELRVPDAEAAMKEVQA